MKTFSGAFVLDTQGRRVPLQDAEGFAGLRRAGRLAAACLDHLTPMVVPGVATAALDRAVEAFFAAHGAVAATVGYKGYTKSSCISVNHVVTHGIPAEDKILRDGDIVNIDVTALLDGWHGDTSPMFLVGNVGVLGRRLVSATHAALMAGIAAVRPGANLGDVGHAIETVAKRERFSVVRDFVGHGIGRVFHDAPDVWHFGSPGQGMKLVPGMVFTIEPMINAGRPEVKVLADGWTAVTRDRSLSAQFEHTIGVTAQGVEIFTVSPAGPDDPSQDPPHRTG